MIAMVLAHEALHLLFAVVAERSDIIASLSAESIVKVWKNRSNCRVVCDILCFAWETTADKRLALLGAESRAPQSVVYTLNSALRHGGCSHRLVVSAPQIWNFKKYNSDMRRYWCSPCLGKLLFMGAFMFSWKLLRSWIQPARFRTF